MDDQAKRNYLLSAKQKYHKKKFQQLLIAQQDAYSGQSHEIFEVLVSQFVMVMNDESFHSIQSQSEKYPLPILYAAYIRCLQNKSYIDALRILHKHLEKHYNLNHHLITFNIAKIYQFVKDYRKSTFYYELVLKEKPIFEYGVFQYCKLLQKSGRKNDAIRFLKNHLISQIDQFQNSTILQSLYITIFASQASLKKNSSQKRIISKRNQQQMNQNLKIFHKRQVHPNVAFNIALYLAKINCYGRSIQIFKKLQAELQPYYGQKAPFQYKKLLIMVRINLAKIYEIQVAGYQEFDQRSKHRQIKRIYECLQKDLPSSDTVKSKIQKYCQIVDKIQQQERNYAQNEATHKQLNRKLEVNKENNNLNYNQNLVSVQTPKIASAFDSCKDQIQRQQAVFAQKRKKNKQKLEYLLKKQKQINQFFDSFGVNSPKIKKMKQLKEQQQKSKLANLGKEQLMSSQSQNPYAEFQAQFERKKKEHQRKYDKDQLESMMSQYLKTNFRQNRFVLSGVINQNNQTNDSQNMALSRSNQRMLKTSQSNQRTLKTSQSNKRMLNTSQKKFRITNKIRQQSQQNSIAKDSLTHNNNKSQETQNNEENNKEKPFQKEAESRQGSKFELGLQAQGYKDSLNGTIRESQNIIEERVNIKKQVSIQPQKTQAGQNYGKIQQNKNVSQLFSTWGKKTRFQEQIQTQNQVKQQKQQPIILSDSMQGQLKVQKFNTTKDAIKQFQQSLFKNSTTSSGSKSNWTHGVAKKIATTSNQKKNQQMPSAELSQFQKAMKVGAKLLEQKKYQQAYGHYTKMYKEYKEYGQKQDILLQIGELFENQNRNQEAQKTYRKCAKFNNPKAFMKLGNLQIRDGRIQEGVQNLQKANCIERFNTQIQTRLVYGYSLRQQTVDKAFALASAILKRSPESLDALIMSANILQKKGRIKDALEVAMAIDSQKKSFQIKHYIGVLHLYDSNVSMAFNYFQEALKIKPDHLPSLIEIGTILSDIRPQQAIQILKKVLQKDPQNRLALARLGKIFESQEEYDNAMNIYKKGLQVQQNYESYIKIGDCLKKKESYIEAYLNYKQALALKKTPQIYQRIAEIYKIQSQFSKAYESYQCALTFLYASDARISQRKRCLDEARKIAMTLKQFDNAIHCSRQLLDIDQSPQNYQHLGDAYYGKGQYTQALEYYQKVTKMSEEERQDQDWNLLQKIALCLDRNQEYLASKVIYEKIINQFPDNVRALNNLACILLIIGQTNQAFYWFENVLLKVPNCIEKRLKVAQNYAQVGDWSKVEYHLMICYKQRQNDVYIIQKLLNLYKEKRDAKQISKFQKKLNLLKSVSKK